MNNKNYGRLVRHEVLPGSRTGVFFIPVTNLPQGATYKDLHDIAKFEKCFIYPNSCEGWVRVRGLDNFRRLSRLLNGLRLRDSTLYASPINEHQPIYVWDSLRTAKSGAYSALAVPRRGPRLCVDMSPPSVPMPVPVPVLTAPFSGYESKAVLPSFVCGRTGWRYRYYYEDGETEFRGVGGGGAGGPAGPASSSSDNGSGPGGPTGSSNAGQQPHDNFDDAALSKLVAVGHYA